jgi:putative nucleotidyltransferase with HDIG domain
VSGHGAGERRAAERRAPVPRRVAVAPPPLEERRVRRDRRVGDRRGPAQRLEIMLDVTRRLMSVTDLDALLQVMAESAAHMLAADRATIYVVDSVNDEIWSRVALGADEIRIPIGRGIAGTVARTGETINLPNAYADPRFNPEPDRASGYRTKSLLTLPLAGNEGSVIGVFQLVNKRGGGPFTQTDAETLASLAASAAVALDNAQLIAEQRRLWLSLIETLAATVDARDQQTAGHSQRVTEYAAVMGKAMGLTGKDLEKLRAGALLHDYGKIAVRDKFLQKPGKLDEAEFEYMKAHAEMTAELMKHLVFPHDMREVPLIAAQHHERMDGKGYPQGLAADQIHTSALIVAAADVFDALTSPRYYKPAYAIERTMEIMDTMAGDHLDPQVVAAVHRALPRLREKVEALRDTWPKPGDHGMGSISDAVGELSERDQPPAAAQP